MLEKRRDIGENPAIFMDWPQIVVKDDKIILKSTITSVTITNTSKKYKKIGPILPWMKQWKRTGP
ncbi:MAG: hypothetical protein JSW00_13240 [Thermoplasmata archaeon]|nr:MAG: hypothetical protein JSW00_13240 [Thermoplasmata archaeon]